MPFQTPSTEPAAPGVDATGGEAAAAAVCGARAPSAATLGGGGLRRLRLLLLVVEPGDGGGAGALQLLVLRSRQVAGVGIGSALLPGRDHVVGVLAERAVGAVGVEAERGERHLGMLAIGQAETQSGLDFGGVCAVGRQRLLAKGLVGGGLRGGGVGGLLLLGLLGEQLLARFRRSLALQLLVVRLLLAPGLLGAQTGKFFLVLPRLGSCRGLRCSLRLGVGFGLELRRHVDRGRAVRIPGAAAAQRKQHDGAKTEPESFTALRRCGRCDRRCNGRRDGGPAHHHRGVGVARARERHGRLRIGHRGLSQDRPPARDRLRTVGGAHRQSGIEADQQPGQESRQGARRLQFAERPVLVVEHAVEGAGRRRSGDRMIERGREAIDVGPWPLLGRGHLLGRGIARREDRRHRRRPSRHRRARGAEVDQGRIALGVEQDVGGLDVAMQEAGGMDLLQPVEQRPQDAVELGWCDGTAFQALLQRVARHQFHDDVGGAVGLEEVEHAHDRRRALQGGERAALVDEALAAPAEILRHLGRARQHRDAVLADRQRRGQVFLDRDLAMELVVAGAIGDAEAALAQDRHDLVAADHLAGRQRDEILLADGACRAAASACRVVGRRFSQGSPASYAPAARL